MGHGFYPTKNNTCLEIHLDASEDWYFGLDNNTPAGQYNFVKTLSHEIGHTLGLGHSSVPTALMFAYYNEKNTLDQDDIMAIQYLYGKKQQISSSKPYFSTTPRTQTKMPTEVTYEPTIINMSSSYDVCELDVKDLLFFILHYNLYIIHKDKIWIMDLKSRMFNTKGMSIYSVLPFLPKFDRITSIYQRPSGDIVLLIKNEIFIINERSFALIGRVNVSSIFTQFYDKQIIGAVNTYSGKTIYFFEDNYYMIVNEFNLSAVSYGYTSKDFSGIPSSIQGVFRYINGMLYFFQDGRYFEYNEFTNSLYSSDKINLNKFDIQCPSLSVYEQLKLLLSKILERKHN